MRRRGIRLELPRRYNTLRQGCSDLKTSEFCVKISRNLCNFGDSGAIFFTKSKHKNPRLWCSDSSGANLGVRTPVLHKKCWKPLFSPATLWLLHWDWGKHCAVYFVLSAVTDYLWYWGWSLSCLNCVLCALTGLQGGDKVSSSELCILCFDYYCYFDYY